MALKDRKTCAKAAKESIQTQSSHQNSGIRAQRLGPGAQGPLSGDSSAYCPSPKPSTLGLHRPVETREGAEDSQTLRMLKSDDQHEALPVRQPQHKESLLLARSLLGMSVFKQPPRPPFCSVH
ncbi:hypothetical protein DPEC_G00346830 [Dallia pectoralis]|uniref:Uncharacterized protein n=1 Tax=Dallia pectoralis TaxID=75939 RepID=A0ACC2F3W4_DALPE|nr:hypothetical protein DPEC_G00346830 [Dallia pectoralis]